MTSNKSFDAFHESPEWAKQSSYEFTYGHHFQTAKECAPVSAVMDGLMDGLGLN